MKLMSTIHIKQGKKRERMPRSEPEHSERDEEITMKQVATKQIFPSGSIHTLCFIVSHKRMRDNRSGWTLLYLLGELINKGFNGHLPFRHTIKLDSKPSH